MPKIFTIGYDGFKLEDFIAVLKNNNVNAIVDVRIFPYPRFIIDYNAENLRCDLKEHGIEYRHYPKEFWDRQDDFSLYDINNQLSFKLFSESEQFKKGIMRLQKSVDSGYTIALMCAEKNPADCHRAVLVGRELSKNGFDVYHILTKDKTITEKEFEMYLVDKYFLKNNQSLDDGESDESLEDKIEKAFELQGKKIAYTKK